jgi:DNA-binding NarL/FixJ family response regulator
MINVAIVEDNNTIREGLAALIGGTEGFKCSGAYIDAENFLKDLKKQIVDVVLMDIALPGINGIEGVKQALKIKPDLNVLMLTIYEDNTVVFDALCAGACGYLVKNTPPHRLIEAVKEVYNGGSPMSSHIARQVIKVFQKDQQKSIKNEEFSLTDREIEVLNSLSEGSNYHEIAESLFISVDTVRHHIRNIYKKLHVHSRSQAVAKAIRKGII